jgi:hypothetical protein
MSSSSSLSDITSKANMRTFRWCMAREKPTAEGVYDISNPTTLEVLQRVVYNKIPTAYNKFSKFLTNFNFFSYVIVCFS